MGMFCGFSHSFSSFVPIQLLIETCIALVLRDVKFIYHVYYFKLSYSIVCTLARTIDSMAECIMRDNRNRWAMVGIRFANTIPHIITFSSVTK